MLADQNINSSLPELSPNWSSVIEAGIVITAQQEYEKLLPAILEQSLHLCASDGAAVILLGEQKEETFILIKRGSLATLPKPSRDSEAVSRLAQFIQPLQLDSIALSSYFPSANVRGMSLIVPVISSGNTVGAIILNHLRSDYLFRPADEAALFTFARIAGVALDNAHGYSQAREEARIQERNTLAKAIHSGAAQTVFILGMEAETGLDITDPLEMRQRLITLRHLATRAGEELSGLITAMRSPQDQHQNPIVPLMQKRLNAFHAQTDIPVAFHVSALPEVIPTRVCEAIYRLLVEYVSILSHPVNTAGVMVSMASNLGKVVIQILDVPNERKGSAMFQNSELEGLRTIVEEVGGGAFSISTADEVGRLIRASFDVVS